jgi:hypothetical protein
VSLDIHGTINKDSRTGGAEVDRLWYEPRCARLTVVSAKRDRGQQQLKKSFLEHVETAAGAMSPRLASVLPQVQKLRLVAVSARPGGEPFSLPAKNVEGGKLRYYETTGKYHLEVTLRVSAGKSEGREKSEAPEPVRAVWEVEARDVLFSEVLKTIPAVYQPCTALVAYGPGGE